MWNFVTAMLLPPRASLPLFGMALGFALGPLWACRPGTKPVPHEPIAALKRGDRVVVESRAAEFHEARVLATEREHLRLELLAKRESVSVAVGDVYRLPPPPAKPESNSYAICHVEEAWLGCKVLRSANDALSVLTLSGTTIELEPSALLLPSALTELNLRQAFSRADTRLRFLQEAERAGQPLAPSGFRPQAHSRVIVRRAGAWYSAVAQEVDHDAVYVTFADSAARDRVSADEVIPEPPWPNPPARGEFALVRPPAPAEPWPTLRVASVADREFHVAGPLGDERVVTHRDLVPLGRR